MTTSGYYDEIDKVEALRRQQLWRFRRRRQRPSVPARASRSHPATPRSRVSAPD